MDTAFTYFTSLPTEIRLQIWRTAQCPRIIKIKIDPDPRVPERPWDAVTNFQAWASRRTRPFNFQSLTPLPASLAVNQESRQETLRLYMVVCDDSGPRFYYNMSTDTLWIEQHEYGDDWVMLVERITKWKWNPAHCHVRSIAIRDDGFHHTLQSPNFAVLVRDSGVQEVFLVAETKVWPVVSETQLYSPLDTFLLHEHDALAEQFGNIKIEGGLADLSPRVVTAVDRKHWEKEGLRLRYQAEHSVVLNGR